MPEHWRTQSLIGLVLAALLWRSAGAIWAIVAAFFFVGGLGWKILFNFLGLFAKDRSSRNEFVEAWESRAGDMRFGEPRSFPPPGAYNTWQEERATTGESARAWLDRAMGIARPRSLGGYDGSATHPETKVQIHPWQSEEFVALRGEFQSEAIIPLVWQELAIGDTGYFESLAFVLNKHIGWDRMGRRVLQDVADGRSEAESLARSCDFLMTDPRSPLAALRGPNAGDEEARDLASDVVRMVRWYVGASRKYESAGEIATEALSNSLAPYRLMSVPSTYLPDRIAGFGRRSQFSG